MKRRNNRTTVLWTCAILAGSCNHVLAGERTPPSPNPSDEKIAALLVDIEGALLAGKMVSLDLSDKLVEARTLWPTASPDGRRMLKEFPGKLRNDQAQLSNDDDGEKSINLRVFGSVAAQYIENTTILDDREPEVPASPQTDHRDDQQQAAIVPQAVVTPPPAPPPQAVVTPSPPPVVATPQPAPSAMATPLLNRGNAMMDIGDIAAARLLFQRAADLGSGSAAMKLARTYDPDFLGSSHGVIGIQPDRATAAIWYRKAISLGEPQAEARLVVLVEHMSH